MAKKISMIPQSQSNSLTENALLDFIRQELNNYYKDCEPNIISKVRAAYPSLRDEQIRDIFQDVCIALVEKAHDGNLRLTCSLFHYVYRCCWNKAEHETRHPERAWQLPTDDIMRVRYCKRETVVKSYMDIQKKLHINAYSKWTTEDDDTLLQMHRDGASINEMMEKFGRNEGSIKSRILKLEASSASQIRTDNLTLSENKERSNSKSVIEKLKGFFKKR